MLIAKSSHLKFRLGNGQKPFTYKLLLLFRVLGVVCITLSTLSSLPPTGMPLSYMTKSKLSKVHTNFHIYGNVRGSFSKF